MTAIRNNEPNIEWVYWTGIYSVIGSRNQSVSSLSWSSEYFKENIDEIKNINIQKLIESFTTKINQIFGEKIKQDKIYKLVEYD